MVFKQGTGWNVYIFKGKYTLKFYENFEGVIRSDYTLNFGLFLCRTRKAIFIKFYKKIIKPRKS